MFFEGVNVDIQGFELRDDQEDQLDSLIRKVNQFLPVTDLKLRFVKENRLIEGMIWCKALGVPIGAYSRCPSFVKLTKTLLKKVSKECRKVHNLSESESRSVLGRISIKDSEFELVG